MSVSEGLKNPAMLDLVKMDPTFRHPTFQPGTPTGYTPNTTLLSCLWTFSRTNLPCPRDGKVLGRFGKKLAEQLGFQLMGNGELLMVFEQKTLVWIQGRA